MCAEIPISARRGDHQPRSATSAGRSLSWGTARHSISPASAAQRAIWTKVPMPGVRGRWPSSRPRIDRYRSARLAAEFTGRRGMPGPNALPSTAPGSISPGTKTSAISGAWRSRDRAAP